MKGHYRVGTRGSRLAVTQTQQTVDALAALHPGTTFELVHIKTTGDKIADVPLSAIGDKGLFVKEIELALLDGSIDVGVHSMKDMPTELPAGLRIGCVPLRRAPWDCLITQQGATVHQLPPQAVVGSGSLRRRAQLAAVRSDLQFVELRGNLPTRLRKLREGPMMATLLALAGLERLGAVQGSEIVSDGETFGCSVLPMEVCVPAVGQGALCLECRDGDRDALDLLEPLDDAASNAAVRAERRFLAVLEGGCQIPAGSCGTVAGGVLTLTSVLCSKDGQSVWRDMRHGPPAEAEAEALGEAAARKLLENSAVRR
ncbi:MAG TPA: hydroxymethylbilane synthase [Candidatus Xenobia bacterium]|jgi:hydroxymethylbilane synthase